jgi:hypothetical protein
MVKASYFSPQNNGSKGNGTWIARLEAKKSSSSPLESLNYAELNMMTI